MIPEFWFENVRDGFFISEMKKAVCEINVFRDLKFCFGHVQTEMTLVISLEILTQ